MTQRALDWGAPRPAEWPGPKERITARLPVDVVTALRERARSEGVSFNTFIQRVLGDAAGSAADPVPGLAWYDGYNPFT